MSVQVQEFQSAAAQTAHQRAVRARLLGQPRPVVRVEPAPAPEPPPPPEPIPAPRRPLVFTFLPDDQPPPRKQVYAFEIRNMVAEHYGLTIEEIIGHNRHQRYVRPRHIAIFLMMKCTGMSSPRIGNLLGGRDHSTILVAEQRLRAKIAADPQLAAEIAELTAKVEARR